MELLICLKKYHSHPFHQVTNHYQPSGPYWSISKWKAHLNVHGSKPQHGVNYWETYAPVVNLMVRIVLALSLLHGYHPRQVDFAQAFTQAPLDCPIFMEIPAGFGITDNKLVFTNEATHNNTKNSCTAPFKNMYGLKQASNNWYKCLHDALLQQHF